jgi:cell fate (sporulation/competence/biofilm development) regulator YmcA (YheA/YmcA/DUF963 family)
MRQIYTLLFIIFLSPAWADDTPATECASRVFADALAQTANTVDETAHETDIQTWIYQTFALPDVLNDVRACPEIANAPDDGIIKFTPVQYIFPGRREIVVNYETQPHILKQRIMLGNKRNLPSGGDSPRIGARGDNAIWTNTDPAWYAIMVVEHGALNNFVGPDKNNTISLNYIKNNIDSLYPSGRGSNCTDRSAKSRDNTTINTVMREHTIDIEDDSNDYYIAGDVNLQWLSYAEMALDVVITVATFGAGTMVMGTTKAARASRALKGMSTTLRTLSKSDDVVKYVRAIRQAEKLTDEIKTLDKVADATKIADKTDELKKLQDSIKNMEKIDDVKKYRDTSRAFSEANAVRRGLRAIRSAQRGNIMARMARATKAAWTGGTKINKAAKLGRSGKISTRIRDWLFNSTMKNIGTLGKIEATGGLLYGAIKFAGDMYDWTETSTGDFTSGVEFAPLLLLSADDLQGQENVVNHGMWLMWAGDSVSAADDDVAYLQAMDFAAKFHQDLSEYQNDTATPCNVDIFVVRPVLRNPGSNNPELYYLIMNDQPWTTNE